MFVGTRNRDPKVLSLPPFTLHGISQETTSLNSCAEKEISYVFASTSLHTPQEA